MSLIPQFKHICQILILAFSSLACVTAKQHEGPNPDFDSLNSQAEKEQFMREYGVLAILGGGLATIESWESFEYWTSESFDATAKNISPEGFRHVEEYRNWNRIASFCFLSSLIFIAMPPPASLWAFPTLGCTSLLSAPMQIQDRAFKRHYYEDLNRKVYR